MSTTSRTDDSRRHFLKTVVLAVTGSAVGQTLSAAPPAGPEPTLNPGAALAPADQVSRISVKGILPADHVVGGVLVDGDGDLYLVFDAVQRDAAGEVTESGTAAVRLDGCVDWCIRNDGDQLLASHPVDPSELDAFGTYEVENSTWVRRLVESHPDPDVLLAGPELVHLIFTFGEVSFECIVNDLDPTLHRGTFADVYDRLTSDGPPEGPPAPPPGPAPAPISSAPPAPPSPAGSSSRTGGAGTGAGPTP